jgi:hypothetical protein
MSTPLILLATVQHSQVLVNTTSNIFNANTSVAIAAVNANVNIVVNSAHKLPMYGQVVSV